MFFKQIPHRSGHSYVPCLVARDEQQVSVGGLLAGERGIRKKFMRLTKENALRVSDKRKGRAQRMKRVHKGRMKKYMTRER